MGFSPYLLLLFGIQSTLSCDTQHYKKDASLKKTPRVGSCHFVDIFLNSFQDKHLELVPAMFQSSSFTLYSVNKCVCHMERWLYNLLLVNIVFVLFTEEQKLFLKCWFYILILSFSYNKNKTKYCIFCFLSFLWNKTTVTFLVHECKF